MPQPRIGITRSGPADTISGSYQSYHARITAAGGVPVDLHPHILDVQPNPLDTLDGLLVAGGVDVQPSRYGAAKHQATDDGDPPRDDLEFGLLTQALTRDLPVLAICRGHQVLNVAMGGTLLQHIDSDDHRAYQELPGTGEWLSRWHDVQIADGTRLAQVMGGGTVHVNSRHHQAVLREGLAPGLIVAATSADGLVEAVEAPAYRWVVGVQWHPERTEMGADADPLFAAFVSAAASVPVAGDN